VARGVEYLRVLRARPLGYSTFSQLYLSRNAVVCITVTTLPLCVPITTLKLYPSYISPYSLSVQRKLPF